MVFANRAGGACDGAFGKNEGLGIKRSLSPLYQAIFASPTGADHKKEAALCHATPDYSSRPISTAGAAWVILLVEM